MRSFILLIALVALVSCASLTVEKGVLTGKWESTAFSNPYPDGSRLLYQFYENDKLEVSFVRPDKQPEILVGEYHQTKANVVMTFPEKGTRTFSYVIDGDMVTLTDLTDNQWVKCKKTK